MKPPTDFTDRDRLDWIFYGQKSLTEKFTPIEMKNGRSTDKYPVDINSREGQIVIKDFLWRITEELSEAVSAEYYSEDVIEELSDALHFMIELCLLSDIKPSLDMDSDVQEDKLDALTRKALIPIDMRSGVYEVIHNLGLAGNELKGRLWKNEFKDTHEPNYRRMVLGAFISLIGLFRFCGCRSDDILAAYFKKHSKNEERIKNEE